MREQTGLGQHELCHVVEVVNGGVEAVLGEPVACDVVALFGGLAECEQGLVAAAPCSLAGDAKHPVG
jgi:hypothetical protein